MREWRLVHSAWSVAAVVALVYAVWLACVLPSSHGARDFIMIGRRFITRSHASPVIRFDPATDSAFVRVGGYDGQFCYYIALDPINARYYIDDPAYRYTRIVYPLVARLLALGRPGLIPYTLVAVNWLALGAGTLAVAAWLRRKRRSPWFALIFGLYPGLFISLQRDLTEPLAYALVALAIYLFSFGGRRAALWSGLAFALAILTRELAAIFAVVCGLSLLVGAGGERPWRERIGRAGLLLGTALLPFVLYKAFLLWWLGSSGVPAELSPLRAPFEGIFVYWPWHVPQVQIVSRIIAPALICAGVGLWALWKSAWTLDAQPASVGDALVRRRRSIAHARRATSASEAWTGPEVWALLANVLICIVVLAPHSYHQVETTLRVTPGVVLAALYCLPLFARLGAGRWWILLSGALWLSFLPSLFATGPQCAC